MSVNSVSISSMFGWVSSALSMFKKNVGSLAGASALMFVLAILMALPMIVFVCWNMAAGVAGGMSAGSPSMFSNTPMFYGLYGLTILLQMALAPPLVVGWFRLCRGLDQGQVVGAMDLTKPYRDSELWFRSIRMALLALALYLLVAALFVAAFWRVISEFMARIAEQQAAMIAGTTPPHPGFPLGIIVAYFAFLFVLMVLQFVYMLAFAEISARPTGALEAMRLSLLGVGKNLWKLVLFTWLLFMICGVVVSCVILALMLVAWLLMLIHWLLAAVVAIVFYVALLLCIYPLMFAGNYYAWKSILGDDVAPMMEA